VYALFIWELAQSVLVAEQVVNSVSGFLERDGNFMTGGVGGVPGLEAYSASQVVKDSLDRIGTTWWSLCICGGICEFRPEIVRAGC